MLTPLAVGPGQPFPYISGLSLSLGVIVRDPETGEERFARVKVPEGLAALRRGRRARSADPARERDLALPRPWLFPEMEVVERVAFRLTRDGDTEISDDADDLLEAVESELRKRRFGAVVRARGLELGVARRCSRGSRSGSASARDSVYPVRGLLDLADVGAALRARPART